MLTTREKCELFLLKNGWERDSHDLDYISYSKGEYLSVDISDSEIILVGNSGDILHIPLCYYSLIGALIEYRQLPFCYISILQKQ